jgi:hypothetical protein
MVNNPKKLRSSDKQNTYLLLNQTQVGSFSSSVLNSSYRPSNNFLHKIFLDLYTMFMHKSSQELFSSPFTITFNSDQ